MSTRSTCVLSLLWLVQGCERFAFFAVLPLFVFYLHQRHGFAEPSALFLVGVFNALSYVGGLPAGVATDRKLGPAVALLGAGALLSIGYGMLCMQHEALLWPSLALLALGHSFFKPSISTLIGSLFPSSAARRERSFLWQYVATNLAAMAGPLCGEAVSTGQRWDRLFLLSGAATFVGTLLSIVGLNLRALKGAPIDPSSTRGDGDPGAATISTQEQHARWNVVCFLCGLAVVMWLALQQAGSSLILFAELYTKRSISAFGFIIDVSPSRFSALHGLMVLSLAPVLGWGMTRLRRCRVEPSPPTMLVWGYVATAAAFAVLGAAGLSGGDTNRVGPSWLLGCYVLLSSAELLLGPLGMSLLTQLAPPNRTAQAVGLWFGAAAVGNIVAGALGLLWGRWPNHRYFALLALVCLGAAMALFACLPWLERVLARSERSDEGAQR